MRALILTALAAFPASAQQQMCAPLDEALASLESEYNETVRMDGLASDGRLVIVTASPEGAWTMIVVDPSLVACLVAHGAAFQAHEPPPPGVEG